MKLMQFIYRKCDVLEIIIYLASLYADNIVTTFIGLCLLSVPALRLLADEESEPTRLMYLDQIEESPL